MQEAKAIARGYTETLLMKWKAGDFSKARGIFIIGRSKTGTGRAHG